MAVEAKRISEEKLSHKEWKKLKRKQKRQAQARQAEETEPSLTTSDSESEERKRREIEEENNRQHALWLERDRQAYEKWKANQEREEKEKQRKEEIERKIREEWEEKEKKECEERELKEEANKNRREKQESLLRKATANENKEWHNPLAPVTYVGNLNREGVSDVNNCPFFAKTGACRFGDRCSRSHLHPESSTTLLIPGFFKSFELRESCVDDYDTDMGLEYEDRELYRSFCDFFDDVLPEFKSVGKVVNFKVCCNQESHLRGNVYVQYKRELDAQKAYMKFNARWYAGRQLSCEFVNIPKWKSAICGLFFSKRCPKGKACNFLHVFKNPRNEFWEADRDFEASERREHSSLHRHNVRGTPRHHQNRVNRSRSRERESSRLRRKKQYSSRSRSKSRSSSRFESKTKRTSHSHQTRSRSRSVSQSKSVSYSKSRSHSNSRSKSRSCSRSKSRSCSKSRSVSKSSSKPKHRKSRSKRKGSRSPADISISKSLDKTSSRSEKKKNKKSQKKKTETNPVSQSEISTEGKLLPLCVPRTSSRERLDTLESDQPVSQNGVTVISPTPDKVSSLCVPRSPSKEKFDILESDHLVSQNGENAIILT